MTQRDPDIVHCGSLLVPPMGKILLRKTWQEKYGVLYKASKCGIERLEVYDNKDCTKTAPSRIITLENCIKITPNGPTHFSITTKTAPFSYEFGAENEPSRNEWLHSLQMVAFRDDASFMTSIEEDNDLYCTLSEPIFTVKIHPSPVWDRCQLDYTIPYALLLTSTEIQLRNSGDNKLLYSWPYCFIRRYGYKSGKFTFEAGRKCNSGEGTFALEYANQQEIFKSLATKMKSMKKALKEDLDFGENPLHLLNSMEARSRSPLPTSFHSVEASFSSQSTLNNSNSSGSIKQIPAKPPRKVLPSKPVEKPPEYTPALYEHVDKYDMIEVRSNAWKTLGIGEVNHTENVGDEDEEEYASWGTNNKVQRDRQQLNKSKAPKILTQPSMDACDYDKLNFFGSSGKLNLNSGYKQVSLPLLPQLPANPPSFNEYDEVQPAMEGVRLADDSHLGYALVRKEAPKNKMETLHHFHNDEPYAVISKPKRV